MKSIGSTSNHFLQRHIRCSRRVTLQRLVSHKESLSMNSITDSFLQYGEERPMYPDVHIAVEPPLLPGMVSKYHAVVYPFEA